MRAGAIQTQDKTRPLRQRVSEEEWRLRCELAAAHRLVAHFVFVDMTYNHISVRLPGEPEHFLVKAENVFMEQVTASNVVKYDLDGKQVMPSEFKASPAAYNVHAAVLKARPDIMAAVHTHSPANLAVSAQKHGLLPLTQQAMRFYNCIAYYPNEADDTTREGTDHMATVLGDKWVMILENTVRSCAARRCPKPYLSSFFELACARRWARSPAARSSSSHPRKFARACEKSGASAFTIPLAATGSRAWPSSRNPDYKGYKEREQRAGWAASDY